MIKKGQPGAVKEVSLVMLVMVVRGARFPKHMME
jgi:hypothetical protein